MRLIYAIRTDVLFQFKHGFYFVYLAITIMYLVILSFIPGEALSVVTPLVIFSDPSVLGLFFIGGIVMLEKMQGVLSVILVSPLRSSEYLLSKIISLVLISVIASLAITFFGYHGHVKWILFILSIILTSGLFTMCGLIICAGCNTVNGYFIKMIPYMLLLVIPCFSLVGFPFSWLFYIVPSVSCLRLIMGAYVSIPPYEALALIIFLAVVNYLFFRFTLRVFEKKIVFQE